VIMQSDITVRTATWMARRSTCNGCASSQLALLKISAWENSRTSGIVVCRMVAFSVWRISLLEAEQQSSRWSWMFLESDCECDLQSS
jgi:hypothetical protein